MSRKTTKPLCRFCTRVGKYVIGPTPINYCITHTEEAKLLVKAAEQVAMKNEWREKYVLQKQYDEYRDLVAVNERVHESTVDSIRETVQFYVKLLAARHAETELIKQELLDVYRMNTTLTNTVLEYHSAATPQ